MRPRSHRSVLPGLVLAVLLAGVGFLGNRAAPLVSPLLAAILLGALVRNLGLVPQAAEPGLRVAARPVLRWGVVLLGLQLSVPQVVGLGWGVVAVIVGTVALTYAAGVGLGRALGLPRSTRTLVAAGTAICGASAVAAMSAALRPEDPAVARGPEGARAVPDVQESAAAAVATVTLFGTLALLGLPVIAGLLGMGEREAGVWIGAGVHEVGQVVAGAGLVGAGALDVAVLAKLGRVVLLAPMVAAVGIAESLRTRRGRGGRSGPGVRATGARTGARITPPVPLFVVGFLVMVLARSLAPLPPALLDWGSLLATLLLTTAMVAMGAGINARTLLRSGGGALVLGALVTLVSTATALVGVLLLV